MALFRIKAVFCNLATGQLVPLSIRGCRINELGLASCRHSRDLADFQCANPYNWGGALSVAMAIYSTVCSRTVVAQLHGEVI